nr:reverse transcriptase domain-containing protein [Tanacetum cinerariifolium]
NSFQFHGLPGDDANKHLDKFLHVTQSIKVNRVIDDALRLYLFPHSLTHHATTWFDRLPRNSINTFEQMAKMFIGKYFPPSMVTKLRNEITNFHQRPDESLFEAWERYKLLIDRCPNHNMLPDTQIDTLYNGLTLRHRDTINAAGGTFMKRRPEECYDLIENITAHHNDWDTLAHGVSHLVLMKVLRINQLVKPVTPSCETCGGPHSYNDYPATMLSSSCLNLARPLDKLYELARTPLNVHCSAVLLKKLPGKLGDPDKFLILCDFPRMNECLALADLDASINLMPLSVWNKLSLPELTPTLMTLELVDRRSFLMIRRALIDVYARELILRVNNEAVTFNLDQTSRYSANYNDMMVNRIDVIDMAYEEYSQEVLGFSDMTANGNPTPYYDPIISTSSPTLTPFEDSDFLLEEVDAFLALEDYSTLPKVYHSY